MEFVGPIQAVDALQDFIIDRAAPLPPAVREALRGALKLRSTVDTLKVGVEVVYAAAFGGEELPDEIKEWAAAAAVYGEAAGFPSFANDSRGGAIAAVLRGTSKRKAMPAVDIRAARLVIPEDPKALVVPEFAQPEPEGSAE